jgi:protein-tyrosine kinase
MSRIQDILAKAERDGTRRTSPSPFTPAATEPMAAAAPMAPVSGANALDTAAFRPTLAPPPAAEAAPAAPELRTASASLHPALVSALEPHSPIAEQYRAIRTRIGSRDEHVPLRSLMITSPGAGDGKSVTAANLALTMAQEHQRNILLVDADLRSPAAHALFGLASTPGLADVLNGTVALDEALVYLPDFNLTVLPAGNAPQYPTELLGSAAMRRMLDTLRARFDRVVLDVPPVAPLADVGTVAPLVDGVVMVVRAGVTQRPALDQALAAFEPRQMLGLVLNEAH